LQSVTLPTTVVARLGNGSPDRVPRLHNSRHRFPFFVRIVLLGEVDQSLAGSASRRREPGAHVRTALPFADSVALRAALRPVVWWAARFIFYPTGPAKGPNGMPVHVVHRVCGAAVSVSLSSAVDLLVAGAVAQLRALVRRSAGRRSGWGCGYDRRTTRPLKADRGGCRRGTPRSRGHCGPHGR